MNPLRFLLVSACLCAVPPVFAAEPLPGEMVLLTSGPSEEHPNTNHRMEIIELRERP